MVLILCPNLFTILLGWDGLGVSSYLLVIYYNREKSYNAGIVTAITNRLGDIIVIIAIGLISSQGH
jgi:NADH-ubiquinone oxidoreductase chain 5